MGFLQELLEMTAEIECPKNFVYWSGLSVISAIKKRKVWMVRPGYILYPNLYVFLLGPPAARKGFAVGIAEKLVSAMECTRVLSGRESIESMLKTMSEVHSSNGKPPLKEASAFIPSEEFAASIIRNREAFTILTDLYFRYQESYYYRTKSGGEAKLIKPYLAILGAINPAHFEDIIEDKDLKGGFIGRFTIIHETKRRVINSGVEPNKVKIDDKKLLALLTEIDKIEGEISLSSGAKDLMNDWYNEHSRLLDNGEMEDPTGALARVHDTINKVAMVVAMDSLSKQISTSQMQQAMTECLTSAKFIQDQAFAAPTRDKTGGQILNITMQEIYKSKNHTIERAALLKKVYRYCNANELDRILDTLMQAKALHTRVNETGALYWLSDGAVTAMKKHIEVAGGGA